MTPELEERWRKSYEVVWQTLNACPAQGVAPGGKPYRKASRDWSFRQALAAFTSPNATT